MDQPEMLTDYPTIAGNGGEGAIIAIIFAILGIVLFVLAVIYAAYAFLLSRIFKKAGIKESIAWVPFYNHWKFLELGGQQGFWAVLNWIPFVNIVSIVFTYVAMYHIGLGFKKEQWFVAIAIFFPILWFIWLGFDDSKWQAKKTVI